MQMANVIGSALNPSLQRPCLEYNCHDFSDEENCTLFTAPNHEKESPPNLQLTRLDVSIDIIEILEINEVDSKVTIRFKLSVTWNDVRIYFNSLQNIEENNIIPNYDYIWRPDIKVINNLPQHEFVEDDITETAKIYGSGLSIIEWRLCPAD